MEPPTPLLNESTPPEELDQSSRTRFSLVIAQTSWIRLMDTSSKPMSTMGSREIRPKQWGNFPQVHQPDPPRLRGPSTKVACERCRTKKIKCDGQRPACQGCRKVNARCVFDTNAGESRTQMFRRETQELRTRLANAEWLLTAVCQGPETTRARIHEAISAGARPDDVFQQLQNALQLDPDGKATSSQREVYTAARVPGTVELEDPSPAPRGWMGSNTNIGSSPYGPALSFMENNFPSSHRGSF